MRGQRIYFWEGFFGDMTFEQRPGRIVGAEQEKGGWGRAFRQSWEHKQRPCGRKALERAEYRVAGCGTRQVGRGLPSQSL